MCLALQAWYKLENTPLRIDRHKPDGEGYLVYGYAWMPKPYPTVQDQGCVKAIYPQNFVNSSVMNS